MAADDADELAAWLRLLQTPGLGRDRARQLLSGFGSALAVIHASSASRRELTLGSVWVSALDTEPPTWRADVAALRAWLASGPGRCCITLGDALYPPALLRSADPPLMLYLQGQPQLLQTPCLAIVGSRNPTPQGADNARAFAEHLGRAGLTVVSGLALGIDGAAHLGALASGAGTIAVVGTGLDRVYPRAHRELAHRISENGLLVSEFTLGTPPLAANFPQRNRIIAGLSLGTLVVEAALRSGSLITSALAAEAGREVFAIPGSIHSPQSRGCHALIKQGAKLVESAQDVIDELGPGFVGAAAASGVAPSGMESAPSNQPNALLEALGYEPSSLDALQARTGLATADLSAQLLTLELDGLVARLPGGHYQRRSRV